MVSVVQLVERQIVVLVVVGSSPTVHPPKSRLLSEVCFFWFVQHEHTLKGASP